MLGARIGLIQAQKKKTDYVYIPFNNTVTEYESDVPITLTPVNVSGSSFIDSSASGLRGTRPSIRINNGNYISLKNNDSNTILKLSISDSFTIQGYFKAVTNNLWNPIFNIGNFFNGGLIIRFAGISPGVLKGGTGAGSTPGSAYNLNTWYHIAITHDANVNSIKLYKDEVFDGSCLFGTSNINETDVDKLMFLGTHIHVPTDYFNGWLSDCVIIKGQSISTKIYQ